MDLHVIWSVTCTVFPFCLMKYFIGNKNTSFISIKYIEANEWLK